MTSTGRLISEFVDDLYHAFVGYGFLWKYLYPLLLVVYRVYIYLIFLLKSLWVSDRSRELVIRDRNQAVHVQTILSQSSCLVKADNSDFSTNIDSGWWQTKYFVLSDYRDEH